MPAFSWLPQPWLSLVLGLTWLLLFNSLAPGHILLGAVLGVLIPLFSRASWPDRPRVYRPWLLLKFTIRVLADIVIANLVVARLILFHPSGSLQARFVKLPLDLKSELAVTVLANTISLTPGTVSSDLDPERSYLLIHCLNVPDEAALITEIKTRYEAPLKEIFEPCQPP